jgi:hypothetical protein
MLLLNEDSLVYGFNTFSVIVLNRSRGKMKKMQKNSQLKGKLQQ